jgi:two-component system, NarL family, nitrate/nitrite sensor histidine kinase NarX
LCAWGSLGAMLAALYDQVAGLALLAFLGPMLVGRQILLRSEMYLETKRAYASRESAVAELQRQIREERSDERRLVAADLHDEILQPLFRVALLAQVLKMDLASGKLLEMEEDLPQLVDAAERASNELRDLIGSLRQSALGRGGLASALTTLVRGASEGTTTHVHSEIEGIEADEHVQLVCYQIAKEAITNALEHAQATNLWIELSTDDELLRLTVKDDGIGFEAYVPKDGHFGLPIMRERAGAIRAQLFIDSLPGSGTNVTLLAPRSRLSEL